MSNVRMLASAKKGGGSFPTSGRMVPVAANAYVDVPFEHAQLTNGWVNCGPVGPTSARPTNAGIGTFYIDTTLSKVIVSDGVGSWNDPVTGGAV